MFEIHMNTRLHTVDTKCINLNHSALFFRLSLLEDDNFLLVFTEGFCLFAKDTRAVSSTYVYNVTFYQSSVFHSIAWN